MMNVETSPAVEDRTCLTYWFPRIEAAGLPVPRTIIADMPEAAIMPIIQAFNGEEGDDPRPHFASIESAVREIGFPCFLRTSHTSGKHSWRDTCYVEDGENIAQHIFEIAHYSELNGMFGELPWRKWAAREFLPTIALGVCERFGDMPLCREFRCFVDGGILRCCHPYWPMGALEQGAAVALDGSSIDVLFERLSDITEAEADEITDLAQRAGRAVGGYWSVDILETERGWFVTDMAEGHKSFHWEDCRKQPPE